MVYVPQFPLMLLVMMAVLFTDICVGLCPGINRDCGPGGTCIPDGHPNSAASRPAIPSGLPLGRCQCGKGWATDGTKATPKQQGKETTRMTDDGAAGDAESEVTQDDVIDHVKAGGKIVYMGD